MIAGMAAFVLIAGTIFDSQHKPVSHATITITSAAPTVSAEADSQGHYQVDLPAGTYTIHAENQESGEASLGPVKVDKAASYDLTLETRFFDEPQFTVAGVTDNTYRGGHGADTVLRSSEELTKDTVSLAQPHHTQAELEERAGHYLEAAREFQRAAEINPSETNLFDWGSELLTHRAPQPAAEVFAKGVHLYPKSIRMLLGLATSYYAAGSYKESAEYFYRATDSNPSDPKPYLFLAKVQAHEITDSAEYRARMKGFAELQPENALANYYYAVSLWSQHDPHARALLEKAIILDPHLASAYLELGITDAAAQQYGKAILNYKKAIIEDPGLQEAHFRLSEAYRLTGDKVNARQELGIYNELSQKSAAKLEQERRDIQQFVIAFKTQ